MARRNPTKASYYPLGGGLDVVTPALSVNPGRALAMVNYEPWYNGGYRRIDGFERFDGRPKPHLQTFVGFDLDTVAGIVVGTTLLTGDTSGAIGLVVAISGLSVAVTKVTGTFVSETCNTSAYTITNIPTPSQAIDEATEQTFQLATEDEYRADIDVVPGANPVRGIWQRGSNVYAIRDNVGATAGILHLSSAAGWTTTGVTMAEYIFFDAGGGGAAAALPVEGDTVTGGTSGATGTVHRVVLHSGATGTNDAAGYLVLTGVAGGPFSDNEKLQVGGTDRADADGANATFAFSNGGVYRFVNHNFFGASSTFRTYGCNGVDPGFEIDENNVVSPILFPQTALADQPAFNTPFLIEEHRNYLFFAYPGGSIQHSVIGEPLVFNGFLGAAEFGMGDEVTGLNSVVGGVLVITSTRETRGLFGQDISDWNLKLIGEQTGGALFSTQKIDTVYALDDLGITSIARTDAFGDFAGATVSQLVQPIVSSLRNKLTDSTIVRESNQYRTYFNDGSCLIMYVPSAGSVNRERASTETRVGVQFGFASYPFAINIAYNSEDENSQEISYFAGDDGYVYQDRVGRSFDGGVISAYVRLAFNQVGSPTYRKRFRRVDLELSAENTVAMQFSSDITYGSPEVSSGLTSLTTVDIPEISIFGGGGFWDDSNWDQFNWDAQNISTARANLTGTGENVGFLIFTEDAVSNPFVIQGITLHYDMRRLQR